MTSWNDRFRGLILRCSGSGDFQGIAVRAVCDGVAGSSFVFRADVKSYYANIDRYLQLDPVH